MPPKSKKSSATPAAVVRGRKNEKKPASGSLSKQIHDEANYDEAEAKAVAERKKKKADSINPQNLSPLQNTQMELIKGVYEFLLTNFTSENFVITLLIGFILNVSYIKFSESDFEQVGTVGFCWLGALSSYVITHITKKRAVTKAINDGVFDKDSPDAVVAPPSFECLYATIFPPLICLLVRKDLLVMNLAISFLLLGLPDIIRIFISITVLFNFQNSDNVLDATFIPIAHFVLSTIIENYAENSFTGVERHVFATLFLNLMYGVPDYHEYKILVILKYLVYWFGGLSLITFYVGSFVRKQGNKKLEDGYKIASLVAFIGVFYTGCVTSLTRILGVHPLTWLRSFLLESELRFNIFTIWVAAFCTLVPFLLFYAPAWELQLRRKSWHFILFGALLYPLIIDADLVNLALIGLIGIFVAAEVLRSADIPFVGPYLASKFRPFQDDRDNQGPVVISYLFLACGVALPVFYNNSVAGLVSLGVGDAAASIVGKAIGQVPWFDRKKTAEGTIAFIFASTAAMYLYKYLGGVDYSWNTIFMSCVFTAVLEGMSDSNDNLIAPVFMFLALEILHAPLPVSK